MARFAVWRSTDLDSDLLRSVRVKLNPQCDWHRDLGCDCRVRILSWMNWSAKRQEDREYVECYLGPKGVLINISSAFATVKSDIPVRVYTTSWACRAQDYEPDSLTLHQQMHPLEEQKEAELKIAQWVAIPQNHLVNDLTVYPNSKGYPCRCKVCDGQPTLTLQYWYAT